MLVLRIRSRAVSPGPVSPSDQQTEPLALVYGLSGSTNQFLKPVISMLLFMLVSGFACLSISAVLISSFSLSLYDDAGRRFVDVHRGIQAGRRRFRGSAQGVKVGVERLMGGARGALDLVVWAAGTRSPGSPGTTASPTSRPIRSAESLGCRSEDDTMPDEAGSRRQRSGPSPRRPSMSRSTSSSKRKRTASFCGTRRSGNVRQPSCQNQDDAAGSEERWTDDEEPPFRVPYTTPHTSRPGSPHRLPKASALPPRPALRVLIPSLFFAIVITLFRLVTSRWNKGRSR